LRKFVLQTSSSDKPMKRFAMQKERIFGFVRFLSLCRNNILPKATASFSWLKECDNTKYTNTVIAAHVEMLINDGFIVVAYLLRAKRNQLEITKHGDLRLKWNLESKRYVISIKRRAVNELA